VKLLAWKWFLAKCPASFCTYHEWEVQPVLCWHLYVLVVVCLGSLGGLGGGFCILPPDLLLGLFLCFYHDNFLLGDGYYFLFLSFSVAFSLCSFSFFFRIRVVFGVAL
jgi:hypothetical protein